jgi:hypothetical protein
MERWREKELRDKYLLALFKKQKEANFSCSQSNKDLCSELGIEYNGEALAICKYLEGKGWMEWPGGFDWVNITILGREKAEEMENKRFEEKERLVLQKLYDERHGRLDKRGLTPAELSKALDLDEREVVEISMGLRNKGWIGGTDEADWIVPAGIKEIEQIPEPATPHVYIQHAQNSPIQIGNQNKQTVNYNQTIGEILPELTALIESIRKLDFEDRDNVVRALDRALELAQANTNATTGQSAWTRIKASIVFAKETMDALGVAYQTLPYWPAVWHFLNP